MAEARNRNLALQVGHQERFVFGAIGLLDLEETPIAIKGHRRGPFSPRGSDVSATLDLMTHDIDLARVLAKRASARVVHWEGERTETAHPDRARTHIAFSNGVTADLEASRIHSERDRAMRVEFSQWRGGDRFRRENLRQHHTLPVERRVRRRAKCERFPWRERLSLYRRGVRGKSARCFR